MKIVAIVSGGLDSVSYLASHSTDECHVLTFNYGQKGVKELEVVKKLVAGMTNVFEVKVIDMSFMKELWPDTQLTDDTIAVEDAYTPTVVVPLRNAVMLTIASAYAASIGAKKVIYGSHMNDVAGYPDCRPEFSIALQKALTLGHPDNPVEIWSPAREGLTKAENLKLGYRVLGSKIFETWSCYKSGERQCGKCESCRNRKKAFEEAGIKDLTLYEE